MFAKDFANFDALLLYCHGTFSVNRVGQGEGIFFMIMLPSKGGEEHVVSNIAWLREKWCVKHDMSKANSRSHTKLRKSHVCHMRSFLLIGFWKLAENTKVANGMQNVDGRLTEAHKMRVEHEQRSGTNQPRHRRHGTNANERI